LFCSRIWIANCVARRYCSRTFVVKETSASREVQRAVFWAVMLDWRVLILDGRVAILRCRKEGLVVGCRRRVRVRACAWRCVERRAEMRGMWVERVEQGVLEVRSAREGGGRGVVVESLRERRIMSSRRSGGRGGVCLVSGRELSAERRISDFVARMRWVWSVWAKG
jgi:hypothetical protein